MVASWLATSPLLVGEMTVNIHRYRWKELLEISTESKFESNWFKPIEAMAPQKWCCTVEGVEGVQRLGKFVPPTFQKTSEKFRDLPSYNFARFLSIPLITRKG